MLRGSAYTVRKGEERARTFFDGFRPFPPFRVAKSRKSLVEKTPQPLTGDACTGGKRRSERIQKKMIKMTVKGRRENADVAEAYKEKIMRYQTFAESQ
ncbi:hypothetical protein ALC53_10339 [Atta colombica]|uniref:Uncharacterized protein n=1 Tax=Atta colombica TaxID=520822 RepID=A0A195B4G9_9HYME|nr:hypothetical protein ALC53_10339 [Atta colombica]